MMLYELLVSNSKEQSLRNAAVPFLFWVLFTLSSLHISVGRYFHNSSESAFWKIVIYPVIRTERLEMTADLQFIPRRKELQFLLGNSDLKILSLNVLLSFHPLSSFHLKQLHFIIHISSLSSLILSAA